MSIDTQKLVEFLRDGPYLRDGNETILIMNAAADHIEAQTAEIALLREALSSVLADLEMRAEDGVMDISQGALDKARAALSGESK